MTTPYGEYPPPNFPADPPAGKPSHKTRNIVLIVVGVVLLLCGVSFAAILSSADDDNGAARPPAVSTRTTRDPTPDATTVDPADDPEFPALPDFDEDSPDPADDDPNVPVKVNGKVEFGEGVYKVGAFKTDGTEVPAGTYQLKARVSSKDMCYWKKSSDSEGDKILTNSLGQSGILEVTLKRGIYFNSERCGIWRQK